jgi:hypothetical protein
MGTLLFAVTIHVVWVAIPGVGSDLVEKVIFAACDAAATAKTADTAKKVFRSM